MEIIVKDGANLNEHYTKVAREIADYVTKGLHLSFGDVEFRLVDNEGIAEGFALYHSPLPTWYTGQNYIVLKEQLNSRYGSLYEMVSHVYYNRLDNRKYTVVYLNKADTEAEMRGVIAHVYGHLHMDYNNFVCRGIEEDLEKHKIYRDRYRKLEKMLGEKIVEKVYDTADSLSSLMDLYPELRDKKDKDYYTTSTISPDRPENDIYRFVIDNAKLMPWEKEIHEMIYDISRSQRFARVKIIHEGFATWVQEKYALYGEKDPKMAAKIESHLLSIADPAHPSQFPYAFGFRLFKNIEERWDKGRFGYEHEILSDEEKRGYDNHAKKGLEKILELVKYNTDWDFIESYADDEFLMTYLNEIRSSLKENGAESLEEMDRLAEFEKMTPKDFKTNILFQIDVRFPRLFIPRGGANFRDNGSLLLEQDLSFLRKYFESDPTFDEEKQKELKGHFTLNNHRTHNTMHRLASVWKKDVFLQTVDVAGDSILLKSDGKEISVIDLNKKKHAPVAYSWV